MIRIIRFCCHTNFECNGVSHHCGLYGMSINDTELALQAELSRKSRDWDTMDWSDDNWEFDDEIREDEFSQEDDFSQEGEITQKDEIADEISDEITYEISIENILVPIASPKYIRPKYQTVLNDIKLRKSWGKPMSQSVRDWRECPKLETENGKIICDLSSCAIVCDDGFFPVKGYKITSCRKHKKDIFWNASLAQCQTCDPYPTDSKTNCFVSKKGRQICTFKCAENEKKIEKRSKCICKDDCNWSVKMLSDCNTISSFGHTIFK